MASSIMSDSTPAESKNTFGASKKREETSNRSTVTSRYSKRLDADRKLWFMTSRSNFLGNCALWLCSKCARLQQQLLLSDGESRPSDKHRVLRVPDTVRGTCHTASVPVRPGSLPSPLAGPLNWVLMGSKAMFPTSLVSGIIRLEWYA